MSDESDLQLIPLDDLAQRCAQETERFRRRQPFDSQYCFELFQRAFQGLEEAWSKVYAQYEAQVAGWVRKHSGFYASGEEVDYFVSGVFIKFWAAMMPDKFREFLDLGHLLRYLQLCVHSVISDYNRAVDSADPFDPFEEPRSAEKPDRRKIETEILKGIRWQKCRDWIDSQLNNKKEQLVIRLYVDEALKPREIFALCPDVFKDVDEIYQIRQNVFARLGRDPEFDQFCGEA